MVHAEAHGSGYEAHLLASLLESTRQTFGALEPDADIFREVKVTADSGFHSRAVVAEIEQTGADVYIADRTIADATQRLRRQAVTRSETAKSGRASAASRGKRSRRSRSFSARETSSTTKTRRAASVLRGTSSIRAART